MKKIFLIYTLITCNVSFTQNDAIIIWCSTESSITYPIVISNDSITEKFASEHTKYRNRISLEKNSLYKIIINDDLKGDDLFTIFNIIQNSYNRLNSFEHDNKNLSYPEIRYLKNGVVIKKLAIEDKEKFTILMEHVKPYLKDIFSESNYIKFCNYLTAIYVDVGVRYFEIKNEVDK